MKLDKDTLYWSRGCKTGCNNDGECCCSNVEGSHKLKVYNWLKDIPADKVYDIFEVRFKNTRKAFYVNCNNLPLENGDIVAVEASPGHDIGIISALGPVAEYKLMREGVDIRTCELRKIYRKAKPTDIEKWQEAVGLEYSTMIKSRQISSGLGLNMKIGDVEYQGDKTKAIFYYIADERVDFRELIKILADEFRIRIEMRQIGARQEAGLIGGIGPCGRELCCAQWMTNFVSVATNAARYQEITINPQKLAGQCSKLKCCLNYELDTYMDALHNFPNLREPLQLTDGLAFLQKTDALKGVMWFSSDSQMMANLTAVPVERVKEIIALNRKGKRVDSLLTPDQANINKESEFKSAVEDENSLTRFDKDKQRGKKRKKPRAGDSNNQNRENNRNENANNSSENKEDKDRPKIIKRDNRKQ